MGSMIWLVVQETFTRRPWKDYQLDWFQVEQTRALKNLEGEKAWLTSGVVKTKGPDGQEVETKVADRIAALEKQIADMEGAIIDTPKRVELEKLKKDLAAAEVNLKDKEILVAFAKAAEDEYYYYYRSAKHHEHKDEEEKYAKTVDDLHNKMLERSKEYDEASAKRDAVSDKVNEIQGAITKAKKELSDLKEGLSAADRAYVATKNRYTTPIDQLLNEEKIEQFWNQEIDLVDRCQTCHMAYDKCGYSAPREIVESTIKDGLDVPALRKKYCLTRDEAARYIAAAAKIKDSWGSDPELDFEKVKGDLKLEEEPVLASAAKLKITPKDAEGLYRTHPDQTPLLTAHPPDVFGCTTCHYGEGRRTKGVGLNLLAGQTAPFDHARHDHYWEVQMLETSNHQVEASCFNCHRDDYELPYAEHATKGRKLVQHLGCTGCHPLGPLDPERKHGPALNKVGGKIDPAWMLSWIQYPRGIRPRTRMPNFWPNAITKDGKPDPESSRCDEFDYQKGAPFSPSVYGNCVQIRERESAYIQAYLTKNSKDDTYPQMPGSANAAHGKELFETIGCQGCHNLGEWTQASHMPGSTDRDLAPNLTSVGDKVKTPGWFFAWVKNPKSYWHETRMPQLRLTDADAWDVAAFLSSQKGESKYGVSERAQGFINEDQSSEKGKKLIAYYGCFGCHEINGFETMARIGADLTEFGSKATAKLDFGDVPEFASDPHSENWEAWTREKLNEPRAFRYERAAARMPQFDVSKEELDLAVIFLKSQNSVTKKWPAHIRHKQTKEQAAIQRGAFLVDVYNCGGCHLIDNRGIDVDHDHVLDGGDIYARLVNDEDQKFRAPPKLIREGAKVYPDWLFGFLKAPFKLRENYTLRMPTFQFTDQQAAELVAYFASKAGTGYPFIEKKKDQLSPEDTATSKKLFAEAQCLNCHNLGAGGPPMDPKNIAPNLRLSAARLQYDWLFHWLKNPQEQIPGVGMPNFFSPVEDKPGEYETPLTDIANGDWRKQVELLRALVIDLGVPEMSAPLAQAAPAQPAKRPVRHTRGR